MKDIQIEGFKKTLDPVTVEYLEENLENSKRVDLRKITEKATNDLKQLENEAAFDYLKIENETLSLVKEIDNSDKILNKLENLLKDFRENLSVIKGEMTTLQEKSIKMNVGLTNRKNLSNEFSEFIESIMLEPKLIEDILKGEINEDYVNNIAKLCKKLANLKRYNSIDNKSVKEIEPELGKLKLKACERIKTYMNNQINCLKKPKTNIQIIQQSNLVNYRIFLYFLKEHNQDIYFELSQNYSKLLSKLYFNNFKVYTDDLSRLLDDKFTVKYCMFPDNPSLYKQSSAYNIDQRLKVIDESDEQLIIAHYESKNNKKFFLEEIFISLNKLFVATIIQEYTFCQNFFCLSDEESLVFFATIFKQSIISVMDKIKNWITITNDIYSLLIIACSVLKTKENLKSRRFIALDHYVNQLESALWSRLNDLFDLVSKEFAIVNSRILRQVLDSLTPDELLSRIMYFIDGSLKVSKYLKSSSFPIGQRAEKLVELTISLSGRLAKESPIEKEELIVQINLIYVIAKILKSCEGHSAEILYSVESKLNDSLNYLVERIMEEYFEKMMKFLKFNKSDEGNLKLVEENSKDFTDNWRLKLANMKNEIEFKFKKADLSSKIVKICVHRILEIYQEFYNYVKSVYPSYSTNLFPVHKLNIDIKTMTNI